MILIRFIFNWQVLKIKYTRLVKRFLVQIIKNEYNNSNYCVNEFTKNKYEKFSKI